MLSTMPLEPGRSPELLPHIIEQTRVASGRRGLVACVRSLAALLMIASLGAGPARAQSEDEIKAAYLLNFARYVEWPENAFASSEAPVQICTLGEAGFESVVAGIVDGKRVGARGFEVVTVPAVGEVDGCHILYLGVGKDAHAEVLAALVGNSVFAIANDEGFAKRGGVANFYRAGKKIRFEINPDAAEQAGLKVSSRLLRLARLVE